MRYFYYDGDKIIAEREGNSWVVRYLLGLRPCGFVANGQVRIYHADRLGSVRWVTDGGQNIVVSYVYEGFGKIVGQNGGGGGSYQFCGLWGYRNDWDAGLLHVGARYYEVETGRWVQKDPIYNPQRLNSFAYCLNQPINFVDPKGQSDGLYAILWCIRLTLPAIDIPEEASGFTDMGLGWAQEIILDDVYRGAKPPIGWWAGVGGTFETIVGGVDTLAEGLRVFIGYRKRLEVYLDEDGDWESEDRKWTDFIRW